MRKGTGTNSAARAFARPIILLLLLAAAFACKQQEDDKAPLRTACEIVLSPSTDRRAFTYGEGAGMVRITAETLDEKGEAIEGAEVEWASTLPEYVATTTDGRSFVFAVSSLRRLGDYKVTAKAKASDGYALAEEEPSAAWSFTLDSREDLEGKLRYSYVDAGDVEADGTGAFMVTREFKPDGSPVRRNEDRIQLSGDQEFFPTASNWMYVSVSDNAQFGELEVSLPDGAARGEDDRGMSADFNGKVDWISDGKGGLFLHAGRITGAPVEVPITVKAGTKRQAQAKIVFKEMTQTAGISAPAITEPENATTAGKCIDVTGDSVSNSYYQPEGLEGRYLLEIEVERSGTEDAEDWKPYPFESNCESADIQLGRRVHLAHEGKYRIRTWIEDKQGRKGDANEDKWIAPITVSAASPEQIAQTDGNANFSLAKSDKAPDWSAVSADSAKALGQSLEGISSEYNNEPFWTLTIRSAWLKHMDTLNSRHDAEVRVIMKSGLLEGDLSTWTMDDYEKALDGNAEYFSRTCGANGRGESGRFKALIRTSNASQGFGNLFGEDDESKMAKLEWELKRLPEGFDPFRTSLPADAGDASGKFSLAFDLSGLSDEWTRTNARTKVWVFSRHLDYGFESEEGGRCASDKPILAKSGVVLQSGDGIELDKFDANGRPLKYEYYAIVYEESGDNGTALISSTHKGEIRQTAPISNASLAMAEDNSYAPDNMTKTIVVSGGGKDALGSDRPLEYSVNGGEWKALAKGLAAAYPNLYIIPVSFNAGDPDAEVSVREKGAEDELLTGHQESTPESTRLENTAISNAEAATASYDPSLNADPYSMAWTIASKKGNGTYRRVEWQFTATSSTPASGWNITSANVASGKGFIAQGTEKATAYTPNKGSAATWSGYLHIRTYANDNDSVLGFVDTKYRIAPTPPSFSIAEVIQKDTSRQSSHNDIAVSWKSQAKYNKAWTGSETAGAQSDSDRIRRIRYSWGSPATPSSAELTYSYANYNWYRPARWTNTSLDYYGYLYVHVTAAKKEAARGVWTGYGIFYPCNTAPTASDVTKPTLTDSDSDQEYFNARQVRCADAGSGFDYAWSLSYYDSSSEIENAKLSWNTGETGCLYDPESGDSYITKGKYLYVRAKAKASSQARGYHYYREGYHYVPYVPNIIKSKSGYGSTGTGDYKRDLVEGNWDCRINLVAPISDCYFLAKTGVCAGGFDNTEAGFYHFSSLGDYMEAGYDWDGGGWGWGALTSYTISVLVCKRGYKDILQTSCYVCSWPEEGGEHYHDQHKSAIAPYKDLIQKDLFKVMNQ